MELEINKIIDDIDKYKLSDLNTEIIKNRIKSGTKARECNLRMIIYLSVDITPRNEVLG